MTSNKEKIRVDGRKVLASFHKLKDILTFPLLVLNLPMATTNNFFVEWDD